MSTDFSPNKLTADHRHAWKLTKVELELELEKATFNTWSRDVDLHNIEDGVFIVTCRNDYAVEWIEHRLVERVQRLFSYMLKRPAEIAFIAAPPPSPSAPAMVEEPELAEDPSSVYVGFPPVKESWTRTPDYFYYEILRSDALPSTKILVAQVIFQTLGHVSLKSGQWREWWPDVSYQEIRELTGIKHKGTIKKAIDEGV
ncbi:MAG: hypothetical protein KDE51_27850, partial [Anaerolineales bacterium]|nr:hypothetical protein [Anaerolineales bacterium]